MQDETVVVDISKLINSQSKELKMSERSCCKIISFKFPFLHINNFYNLPTRNLSEQLYMIIYLLLLPVLNHLTITIQSLYEICDTELCLHKKSTNSMYCTSNEDDRSFPERRKKSNLWEDSPSLLV